MERSIFEVQAGTVIDRDTGTIKKNEPFYMASRELYCAKANDRIIVRDWAYLLAVATYDMTIPGEYIYTYTYEPEQNWSRYNLDYDDNHFSTEDYVFEKDCYFRICLKKRDGNWVIDEDAERINEIVSFHSDGITSEEEDTNLFAAEIRKTADKILEKISLEGSKSLVFILLADSHYVLNGTWKDTICNIKSVDRKVGGTDGIIHLGDLQDGLLDKQMCRRISARCIGDLRAVREPVYLVIGNHDTNYFRGNTEWLSEEEQYGIFGRWNDKYVKRDGIKGYYYVDYEHVGLRMFFLVSFDHKEKVRYGFSSEELQWLENKLEETPAGYKVLVFSHDAPLERLDYWASDIRNGERLTQILENYNARPGKAVLGYVHGHTHADYIYNERSFPIISIGCSKIEYFPDKKPKGSVRYERKLNHITQDLWDVLIVTPDKRKLDFVRFGAGEDRTVSRKPKIWAHRGASGYAPENTLEAFLLATDMGADGVGLDVQLTKDGQIVVVHDETIQRVSDGKGRVADYTLEELKTFNFNKTHPEYCEICRIPTLREVLECLKDTGLKVNIELKTGIVFYEGIEEKTALLVQEMGYEDRVLYSSFNHCSVLKVREYQPEAKIAFLYSHELVGVAEYAVANGVYAVNPSVACTLFENEMSQCQRLNVDINVWTVDNEEDMCRLMKMGVNALITNYPDVGRRIVDGINK